MLQMLHNPNLPLLFGASVGLKSSALDVMNVAIH